MMTFKTLLATLLATILLLSACSSSDEETPTSEPAEPTVIAAAPTAEAAPTNTPVPAPTDTPVPTDTPEPTDTAEPTATPEPTDEPDPTDEPPSTEEPASTETVTPAATSPPADPTAATTQGGWPNTAAGLPSGNAASGQTLYTTFGCIGCHGDPQGGTGIVGPWHGNLGNEAANRVAGQSAADYIYQSILNPNAFIAPQCPGGFPCASPSIMPVVFGQQMTAQQMADLVAYLLTLKTE